MFPVSAAVPLLSSHICLVSRSCSSHRPLTLLPSDALSFLCLEHPHLILPDLTKMPGEPILDSSESYLLCQATPHTPCFISSEVLTTLCWLVFTFVSLTRVCVFSSSYPGLLEQCLAPSRCSFGRGRWIYSDYKNVFGNLRKSSFLAEEEKQNSSVLSGKVFPCHHTLYRNKS